MRKASFQNNHQEFDDWIWPYSDFIGELVSDRRVILSKGEKRELIEATVHRVCARWDALLEADIITSLNRNSTKYSKELGLNLRKHLTREECKAVLFGHRYINFRNVGDIKSFGRKYLHPKHNPFDALTTAKAQAIDDFFVIRNMLAHYSRYARRKYERRLKAKHTFARIPQPGDYLLAADRGGNMIRWTAYVEAFIDASMLMRKRVC